MKRTSIYLHEAQVATLDEFAKAEGLSRAELIRRLLDRAIEENEAGSFSDDFAAMEDSFGALRDDVAFVVRGLDERSRHLERIAR